MQNDDLLAPNPGRHVLFPIKYPKIWDMYKRALGSFWVADEIQMSDDVVEWRTQLNDAERSFIQMVLAFFAASDGIVIENLAVKFLAEVQLPEVRSFYAVQIMMETVHSETYSLMLMTLVQDPDERERLFAAVQTIPTIKRKSDWAAAYMTDAQPFAARLVAFSAVEGIFFSASFCALFWLKKRGLMPGLTYSNELISRDEGLHCDFACLLYKDHCGQRLSDAEVQRIVGDAVEVEQQFVDDALSDPLIGLNANMMKQYVRFVADRLLVALGHPKLFHDPNPFDWMELISLQGKTNFFEKRVSDYSLAGVTTSSNKDANKRVFSTDHDF